MVFNGRGEKGIEIEKVGLLVVAREKEPFLRGFWKDPKKIAWREGSSKVKSRIGS
jgi:hypothetical protein